MGTDPEFLIPSLAEGVKSNQRKIRIDARADAPHNPFNQRWSAVSQACNVTAVATVSDTPIQSIQRAAWHKKLLVVRCSFPRLHSKGQQFRCDQCVERKLYI
jgi:tRNA(Ile2) C34 agmatinyltransferase TiaS